jgi:orotate phosphoribosyltransferase
VGKSEIIEIFRKTEALLEGHFLLTSGKHSDKYFQCAKVLQYPEYNFLFGQLISEHFNNFDIDTVVSPAIGGIVAGQEVARQLNKRFIFTERENGKMTLRRGFTVSKGEKILIIEDVVTTGGSVFEVIEEVKKSGALVVGVGSIVDRSNGKVDFSVPFYSTLALEVQTYEPEECPMCKANVPIVKPGSRKLNGEKNSD